MELRLHRDTFEPDMTLGILYVDGDYLGQTLEDCDRHLEAGGEKVYGETAIPRGRYRVVMSWSPHFGKLMPEVLGVAGFVGVRIHGGNSPANTLGCVLLGEKRTSDGIEDCAPTNQHLRDMLEECELKREEVWLTVE